MAQHPEIGKLIDRLLQGGGSLYNNIRDDLANQPPPWGFSLHHAESMKSLQDNLNTLAIIATFLAGVQAQVNTYSIQTNSTRLQVAVNVIFFVGLFLDILGACIAYAIAVELQNINSLLLRRASSVSQITLALGQYSPPEGMDEPKKTALTRFSSICRHIRSLEILFLHAINSRTSWEKVFREVRKCWILIPQIARSVDERLHDQVHVDLLEYEDTADELDKSRSRMSIAMSSIPIIRLIVFGGVICLIVGLLLFGMAEKQRSVWIAFVVALSLSLAMLVTFFSSLCLDQRREKKERVARILDAPLD